MRGPGLGLRGDGLPARVRPAAARARRRRRHERVGSHVLTDAGVRSAPASTLSTLMRANCGQLTRLWAPDLWGLRSEILQLIASSPVVFPALGGPCTAGWCEAHAASAQCAWGNVHGASPAALFPAFRTRRKWRKASTPGRVMIRSSRAKPSAASVIVHQQHHHHSQRDCPRLHVCVHTGSPSTGGSSSRC